MAEFIKNRIKTARRTSVQAGQNKYYEYFHPQKYRSYKASVDIKLTQEGCADCIVEVD